MIPWSPHVPARTGLIRDREPVPSSIKTSLPNNPATQHRYTLMDTPTCLSFFLLASLRRHSLIYAFTARGLIHTGVSAWHVSTLSSWRCSRRFSCFTIGSLFDNVTRQRSGRIASLTFFFLLRPSLSYEGCMGRRAKGVREVPFGRKYDYLWARMKRGSHFRLTFHT